MITASSPLFRFQFKLLAAVMLFGVIRVEGALTVSATAVQEGNDPTVPGQAVFTLTLQPAEAVDTHWEYTTAADTAREGSDFVFARGRLTIPAGSTTGSVSVPLVADATPESAETFSLLVWPQGSAPVPSLTQIQRPVGDAAFIWGAFHETWVSEGTWVHSNFLGTVTPGGWSATTNLGFNSQTTVYTHLNGSWLLWRGGFASRQRPGLAPWAPAGELKIAEGSEHISVAGNLAAVITPTWDVGIIRLHYSNPPEVIARFPIAIPKLDPTPPWETIPTVSVRALHFTGDRIILVAGSSQGAEVRIYKPERSDLTKWALEKTIPDADFPLTCEGDTLVARLLSGPDAGSRGVFLRNAGGVNEWGKTTTLRLPGNLMIPPFNRILVRGGLILVGDPGNQIVGDHVGAGRIHVFSANDDRSTWSHAGQFESPVPVISDAFGSLLAQGGLDFMSVSGGYSNPIHNQGWGGSFNGARVSISDDDLPAAYLAAPHAFEPTIGPSTFEAEVRLTTESSTPVSVTWQAESGTARSGQDFQPAGGVATIAPGQLSVKLGIPLLADTLAEEDEQFTVRILNVSGANFSRMDLPVRLHDTARPAVVEGNRVIAFESAPPVGLSIQLYPSSGPLTVGVEGVAPVSYFPIRTPYEMNYAVPGVDWAAAPLSVSASSNRTEIIPLTGLDDNFEETTRTGLLRFILPPGAVGASFSERLIDSKLGTSAPSLSYRHPTTDGTWAAAIRQDNEKTELVIFRRSTGSPGTWELASVLNFTALSQAGIVGTALKLRNGRLGLFDEAGGKAWIFKPADPAGSSWVVEAALSGLLEGSLEANSMDFDGFTLVASKSGNSQVMLIDRASGSWEGRQVLELPGSHPHQQYRVCLDQGRLFYFLSGVFPQSAVAVAEKSGDGPSPWKMTIQFDPVFPTSQGLTQLIRLVAQGPWLGLVFQDNFGVAETQLYRRSDNGSWQLIQKIPVPILKMDLGVMRGFNVFYAETGPAGAPWQKTSTPTEPIFGSPYGIDLCQGVLTMAPNSGSEFSISEAGTAFILMDEDTFTFQTPLASVAEPNVQENFVTLSFSNFLPLPFPVTIPFRTGTGGTATPGLDFRPVDGAITLAANANSASFVVPILPDGIPEPLETVEVIYGPPSYGRMSAPTAPIQITSQPLRIIGPRSPVFVPEPTSGSTTFNLAFQCIPAIPEQATVVYSFLAGTASAADVTLPSGNQTITLAAGRSGFQIPVTILSDALTESPETFTIRITSIGGLAPSSSTQVTITIDDVPTAGNQPDAYTLTTGQPLSPDPSRNVLSNDSAGHAAVTPAREPAYGSVSWQTDGTFTYTPPPNFIGTDWFAYYSGETSIPANQPWKYLHPLNNQDPGQNIAGFHSNWMTASFNDASWLPGMGLMGYGDMGPSGLLPNPITTSIGLPVSGGRYTAYLRTIISLPNQPVPGVFLDFACDDAVIFYLNGTLLGRFAKAPQGSFATAANAYRLLAPTTMGETEELEVRRISFPSAQLQQGPNVLAVSLHNSSSTSTDLGFQLHRLSAGSLSTPTYVSIAVTDPNLPPVLTPDAYSNSLSALPPRKAPPLDSRLLGSSTYSNDNLTRADGNFFDPILEVELGGNPAGPVSFDLQSGHFLIAAPPDFYGTTGFTYRLRDKDGWSQPATVTVTLPPASPYNVWRQNQFGTGFNDPAAQPMADGDGDGMANLLEFILNTNPALAQSHNPLGIRWNGSAWVAEFRTLGSFPFNFFIVLESTQDPASPSWETLVKLSGYNNQLNSSQPGVGIERTTVSTFIDNKITLPSMNGTKRFFRLRATEESHPLSP